MTMASGEKRKRDDDVSLDRQRWHAHWQSRRDGIIEATAPLANGAARRKSAKWLLTKKDIVHVWPYQAGPNIASRYSFPPPYEELSVHEVCVAQVGSYAPWLTRMDPSTNAWELLPPGALPEVPDYVNQELRSFDEARAKAYRDERTPYFTIAELDYLCGRDPRVRVRSTATTVTPPVNGGQTSVPSTGTSAGTVAIATLASPSAAVARSPTPTAAASTTSAAALAVASVGHAVSGLNLNAPPAPSIVSVAPVRRLPPLVPNRRDWSYEHVLHVDTSFIRLLSLRDAMHRLGYQPSEVRIQAVDIPKLRPDMSPAQGLLFTLGVSMEGLIDSQGHSRANQVSLEDIQLEQLGLKIHELGQLLHFVARMVDAGTNLGTEREIEENRASRHPNRRLHEELLKRLIRPPNDLPRHESWVYAPTSVAVTWARIAQYNRWMVQDGKYYHPSSKKWVSVWFLQLVTPANGRRVVLHDPTIVAQVLLSTRFDSVRSLLVYCVEAGIQVNTPEPREKVDPALLAQQISSRECALRRHRLRAEPSSYQYSPDDFATADAARRGILEDPVLARAAAMSGGFIWRVSVGLHPLEVALQRPSSHALLLGIGAHFRLGHGRQEVDLYDDGLTPELEDALVGAWYVAAARGEVAALKSFWPPVDVWNRYSSAGWDARKEHFYQTLASAYHSGNVTTKPQNATWWKDMLRKKDVTARKLVTSSRHYAEKFLASRSRHSYLRAN